MILDELEKIINSLENILKKDSRWNDEGDNVFKYKLKKLYKKQKKQVPVSLSGLSNFTNLCEFNNKYYTDVIHKSVEPIQKMEVNKTQQSHDQFIKQGMVIDNKKIVNMEKSLINISNILDSVTGELDSTLKRFE